MARNKKPRKARQPDKVKILRNRRDTLACRLFRWDSADTEFDVYGPFSRDKNQELMVRALTRQEKWLCVVTACFLDENGDYYEEVLTFAPFGPFKLAEELEELDPIFEAAVAEAKSAGNPAHYKDTITALFLWTPELEEAMEQDEWVKTQAATRAAAVQKAYAAAAH